MEIFKDIPNYEGLYKVSIFGNVKNIKKNKLLKERLNRGYNRVALYKNGIPTNYGVHQLVVMAFLNHTPDGTQKIVVDHINGMQNDNRLENLQLISHRENCSKDKKGTSKYIGVSWSKEKRKWAAVINIKGKTKYLGRYKTEIEASNAYQAALKTI